MATSKGHMKRPCKGICSTTPKQSYIQVPASVPDPSMPGLIEPHDLYADNNISHTAHQYNIINDVDDQTIANVFCFGAFADEISGVVYNNCTGKFPYMSLDGNICFSVMYHYKTSAILGTPIPGLDFASILDAYKKNFEYLESKSYKLKVNVMDNQATKVIKAYLNPRNVQLQLDKPKPLCQCRRKSHTNIQKSFH